MCDFCNVGYYRKEYDFVAGLGTGADAASETEKETGSLLEGRWRSKSSIKRRSDRFSSFAEAHERSRA